MAKDGTNSVLRTAADEFVLEVNLLLPQKNYRKDFQSRQLATTFQRLTQRNLKRLTCPRVQFCKV